MAFVVELVSSPGPDYANGILNPVADSEFSPDYGFDAQLPDMFARAQMDDGTPYLRRLTARGRVFNFQWNRRPSAVKYAFEQWEAQYEGAFFNVADWEKERYFAGMFGGPLVYSPAGNEQWNIKGQFVEIPGKAMYEYPTDWARDAIMIDETDDEAAPLVKLTGAWVLDADANHHGGHAYRSNTPGDFAEWIYFGYGCWVWSMKGPNQGKMDIYLDGNLVAAAADGYSVASVASAQFAGAATSPLGLHRLKIIVNAAKNAASSDYRVYADALQVMR